MGTKDGFSLFHLGGCGQIMGGCHLFPDNVLARRRFAPPHSREFFPDIGLLARQGGLQPPPPPLKVGAPQKTQKMKPPCYCWQYRPQTQPIIDQATDLTVCKIGSLIVTVGLYIIFNWLVVVCSMYNVLCTGHVVPIVV